MVEQRSPVRIPAGGDPNIGQNIAELLVPEMGETVDQNMMAALMSSSSMINAGASTEEVSNILILRHICLV